MVFVEWLVVFVIDMDVCVVDDLCYLYYLL